MATGDDIKDAKTTRRRYALDRLSQRTPVRPIDAFFLRHPVANAGVGVASAVIGAVVLHAFGMHWVLAAVVAAAAFGFTLLQTRANHRRRLANGTSAAYGEAGSRQQLTGDQLSADPAG
jgi:hypothetical protein